MRHEQEERVDALVEFGFSIERARFLAIGRTLDQITYWTRRSAGKRDPEAYFLTLHAGNEPAPRPKASKDRPAPAEDTVERDRRNQEIGRLYDDLDAGMLDGAEDTLENRRAVLMRLGFSEFAAHELAREATLAQVLRWIAEACGLPAPRVMVRQRLVWNSEEPPWPTGPAPSDAEMRSDVHLLRQYHAQPSKRLRLSDGRVVVHRPEPEGWAAITPILREILGREPWSDYSDQEAEEVMVGFIVPPLPGDDERETP